MSGLLVFFDSGYKCADRLRHVRWHNCTPCPHSSSYNVKKDGRYRSYQKYYCKYCRKSFNDNTGNIFHYSHNPLRIFIMKRPLPSVWFFTQKALYIDIAYIKTVKSIQRYRLNLFQSRPICSI